MVIIQVVQGVAEILRRTLRELVKGDISNRVGQGVCLNRRRVADGLQVNVFADDRDLERLLHTFSLELQDDGRTRFAAEVIADLTHAQTLRRLAIYGKNAVTCLHTCPLCRLALIGVHCVRPEAVFGYFCLSFELRFVGWPLLDNRTDTAVLTRGQHTQIAVVLLRIINGIRVDLTQHRVNRRLRQILIIEGIDVVHIDLTHHVVEDRDTLIHSYRRRPLLRVKTNAEY